MLPVGGLSHLRPVFAFFKCDVRYSPRLTWNLFPGSALATDPLAVSEDYLELLYPDFTRWTSEFSQRLRFLITIFLCEILKISTFFSPDLAVTWGVLSKWHFSLCPSECMLYECVTMNSLCIFTWRKKTKNKTKKNCPRISKAKQRPSPTEFSM